MDILLCSVEAVLTKSDFCRRSVTGDLSRIVRLAIEYVGSYTLSVEMSRCLSVSCLRKNRFELFNNECEDRCLRDIE
jgi:hypothetical protein